MSNKHKSVYLEYGISLYNTKEYSKIIRMFTCAITPILNNHPEIVGFIGRGSSSAMIAAGLLKAYKKRNLVYVNVNKGHSHNGAVSGDKKAGCYIFVDDWIESGETFYRCWNLANRSYNMEITNMVVFGLYNNLWNPPNGTKLKVIQKQN